MHPGDVHDANALRECVHQPDGACTAWIPSLALMSALPLSRGRVTLSTGPRYTRRRKIKIVPGLGRARRRDYRRLLGGSWWGAFRSRKSLADETGGEWGFVLCVGRAVAAGLFAVISDRRLAVRGRKRNTARPKCND